MQMSAWKYVYKIFNGIMIAVKIDLTFLTVSTAMISSHWHRSVLVVTLSLTVTARCWYIYTRISLFFSHWPRWLNNLTLNASKRNQYTVYKMLKESRNFWTYHMKIVWWSVTPRSHDTQNTISCNLC